MCVCVLCCCLFIWKKVNICKLFMMGFIFVQHNICICTVMCIIYITILLQRKKLCFVFMEKQVVFRKLFKGNCLSSITKLCSLFFSLLVDAKSLLFCVEKHKHCIYVYSTYWHSNNSTLKICSRPWHKLKASLYIFMHWLMQICFKKKNEYSSFHKQSCNVFYNI